MKSQADQFQEILHDELPFRPWDKPVTRRLPGVQPLDSAPWLWRDETFSRQMAYRDYLLKEKADLVLQEPPKNILEEIAERVFKFISADPDYQISDDFVVRPDGVAIERDNNLANLARLIQEDILIHEKQGDEHVLVAGALCFPANWSLPQKMNKTLTGIHVPVPEYGDRIAKGVQRMFDLMQPDKSIWRANFVAYNTPELHQPFPHPGGGEFMRVERQILTKLPKTKVVIFTLHTFVYRMDKVMQKTVEPYLKDRHR